jgi:hypothetical protein
MLFSVAWPSALLTFTATAAGQRLDSLDLFTVVAGDQMADVDGAVYVGVRTQALQASVVRLYGFVILVVIVVMTVIVIVVMGVYPICVHS